MSKKSDIKKRNNPLPIADETDVRDSVRIIQLYGYRRPDGTLMLMNEEHEDWPKRLDFGGFGWVLDSADDGHYGDADGNALELGEYRLEDPSDGYEICIMRTDGEWHASLFNGNGEGQVDKSGSLTEVICWSADWARHYCAEVTFGGNIYID